MPDYLKISLTLAQARRVVTDRYTDRATLLYFLMLILPILSCSVCFTLFRCLIWKKMPFVETQLNDTSKFMKAEKHHGFVLFRTLTTEEVFAIFTDTATDSP